MAYHRIWTKDIARGNVTYLGSSTGAATAVNTVDGDPSCKWVPGSSPATWEYRPNALYTVVGYGVSGHNLYGSNVKLYDSDNGSSWTLLSDETVVTTHDFVVSFTGDAGYYWRLVITSTSAISIGVISLLVDYGFTNAGAQSVGSGYGVITLGNEGMVTGAISRSVIPSVATIETVGGVSLQQYSSAPTQVLSLTCAGMRDGADQEWWKLRQSFEYVGLPVADPRVNAGWAKGVWLTNDEHVDNTTCPAWYCQPIGGLDYSVGPGGRVTATVNLRTRSVGV